MLEVDERLASRDFPEAFDRQNYDHITPAICPTISTAATRQWTPRFIRDLSTPNILENYYGKPAQYSD
jgi:hypothetical protein